MRRQDFYYDLPEELIALQPTPKRSDSRLLCLDGPSGRMQHQQFCQLPEHLQAGDVVVFNDTRVIPARLFAHKTSGGNVEILVERILNDHKVLAHVRASNSPKPSSVLVLENAMEITVVGRDSTHDNLFALDFGEHVVMDVLNAVGHIPLPPYIDRQDTGEDHARYQTIYAREPGAVAAPTAGLHFDADVMAAMAHKGIETVYVTLHVGAGTFQSVRVNHIADHTMHSERIQLSQPTCDTLNRAKAEGRRIIAAGTTSLRCLEAVAQHYQGSPLASYEGETDIFITPGYQFQIVDALVTNFHLPESTLIMLVSAFAGYQHTMAAYEQAVAKTYRFFSYGDAMFITRHTG